MDKRQTNIEILRIMAMFLVLAVHANFYSLGTPTHDSIVARPFAEVVRTFLCIASCVCVNLFILISGWFSIKPTIKRFASFIFQCLYFMIGIYAVMTICYNLPLNLSDFAECLFMSKWDWFIKVYIALYILSPILNAYIEKSTPRQIGLFLIALYVFQTIYGFRGAAGFILNGHSIFNFIGLYILGRYMRLYINNLRIPRIDLLLGAIIPLLLSSAIYVADAYKDTWYVTGICMSSANPVMIISACCILMLFAKSDIKYCKPINFIAASAFAAYLFHFHPKILQQYFCPISVSIYDSFDGLICILAFILYLSGVFLIAVMLDQPRILLWKKIEQRFFAKKENVLTEVCSE